MFLITASTYYANVVYSIKNILRCKILEAYHTLPPKELLQMRKSHVKTKAIIGVALFHIEAQTQSRKASHGSVTSSVTPSKNKLSTESLYALHESLSYFHISVMRHITLLTWRSFTCIDYYHQQWLAERQYQTLKTSLEKTVKNLLKPFRHKPHSTKAQQVQRRHKTVI